MLFVSSTCLFLEGSCGPIDVLAFKDVWRNGDSFERALCFEDSSAIAPAGRLLRFE